MSGQSATTCVFCRILRGELTPGVLAFCDSHIAVFPSRIQQPNNLGHMLVVPVRHVANIYEIDSDLAGALMTMVARVAVASRKIFTANGISIRQNNDPHGGQDVFHLHFHVVPRFADDGFTGLDPASGAIEVPVEQRIEQAEMLAEGLRQPP